MSELIFRTAHIADVPIIVKMLADDDLGKARETMASDEKYIKAFEKITQDNNSELIVAELADKVIGVLQITFITYLTYQGGTRALIEGVRVDSAYRGKGWGRKIFEYAISRAKSKDCHMVQLTTNKTRKEAFKFYESLGFVNSHEGMKLFFHQ